MANLDVAGFELAGLPEEDPIRRVLDKVVRRRLGKLPTPTAHEGLYWNAGHFALERSGLFQELAQERQEEVLRLLSTTLLQEALHIETAGVGYMARMTNQAETLDERLLYANFVSDEALHLVGVRHFHTGETQVPCDDPFLKLLSELVAHPDRAVVLFLIQVVLEGWGLTHYKLLAEDCQDPGLQSFLNAIVVDEAAHHGAGMILFDRTHLEPASHQAIVEALASFLSMVQAGPQQVLSALDQVTGGLTRAQRQRTLEELDTEGHSQIRLNLLQGLMRGEGAAAIVEELATKGCFRAMTAQEAA
jgi:hypothetical protein